jgi:excisionase family DNA binding protein
MPAVYVTLGPNATRCTWVLLTKKRGPFIGKMGPGFGRLRLHSGYEAPEGFGRLLPACMRVQVGERSGMEKLSEYLLTKEAADLLGVSQNTLRAWAEDGRVPMHRNPANGYRLFRREDLEKILAKAAKPVLPLKNRKKPR